MASPAALRRARQRTTLGGPPGVTEAFSDLSMQLHTEFETPTASMKGQLVADGKWHDPGDFSGDEDGSLRKHLEGYYNGRCTKASLTEPTKLCESVGEDADPFIPLSGSEMGKIAYRGSVLRITKWDGEYATYDVPRGYLTVRELHKLCNRHIKHDVPRRHRAGRLNLDHCFFEGLCPLAEFDDETGEIIPWEDRVYGFHWGS